MLKFNEKTLIQRQIEVLNSCGINDISIITGYNKEKITYPNIKYFHSPEYSSTNMVVSLMQAKVELCDDVIVCYSDIIYEKNLIENLIDSKNDVCVLADEDYLDYWKARLDDWEDDMESFVYDKNLNLLELGNTSCELKECKSRYVGLIKFSKIGILKFVELFEKNKDLYWNSYNRWKKSKSFKQAYMTCMLQELIDNKFQVKVSLIKHGWMEFDTVEDYEKAVIWEKTGEIKKYINL